MSNRLETTNESLMQAYRAAGTLRAKSLGNRGPLRFDPDGQLDLEFLESYRTHGFYVFENVLDQQELKELEADVHRQHP